jgi:alkylhydroperoxidase family enzyme
MNAPRIAPLEPPYAPDVDAALRKWMPPNSGLEPLALFRTLMVHSELASRMLPTGAGILGRSALVPAPLREVMIHRTCALTGAEYEWGVHAVAFGLEPDQLASTATGAADDPCWSAAEAAVFRLADELHATSTVSDALWDELAGHFTAPQLLELLITAGWYHAISYVCNGARVALEPWAARLPT